MPYRLWLARTGRTSLRQWTSGRRNGATPRFGLCADDPFMGKALFQVDRMNHYHEITYIYIHTDTQVQAFARFTRRSRPIAWIVCNSMNISLGFARYSVVLWSGANCRFDKSRQCCLPATRSRAAQQPKAVTSREDLRPSHIRCPLASRATRLNARKVANRCRGSSS
jgi:hypothetical protein